MGLVELYKSGKVEEFKKQFEEATFVENIETIKTVLKGEKGSPLIDSWLSTNHTPLVELIGRSGIGLTGHKEAIEYAKSCRLNGTKKEQVTEFAEQFKNYFKQNKEKIEKECKKTSGLETLGLIIETSEISADKLNKYANTL